MALEETNQMTSSRRRLLGWAAAAAGLSAGACGPGSLAEAGGAGLAIDDAARLIAEHSRIPVDSQVVQVVAQLWVDYTLLSQEMARDTSLAGLDVSAAVRQPLEEIMLQRLQAEAIAVDSVVDEEELRQRFALEMPGARATASQILFAFPPGATSRQRDSVAGFATLVRDRAAGGEDFARLALEYSSDPGSARFGGSMGTFERGVMLPPIDEVAFSLPPGEISDPIETSVGFHILRVDAVEVPAFEEIGGEYRARVLDERRVEAEEAYVDELADASDLMLSDDALAMTRAIAENPLTQMSEAALGRPVASFQGGAYTVDDLRTLVQNASPGFLDQLLAASDESLTELVSGLAKQEMLVQEARSRGLAPTQEESDSVEAEARAFVRDLARQIGLAPGSSGAAEEGPTTDGDVTMEALRRVVSGSQEIIPLGGITFLLREGRPWRIHDEAVGTTIERAREIQRSGAGSVLGNGIDRPGEP